MRLGLGLGLSGTGSGGSTPAPLLAPYKDDFTTVSGTLNGRTITGLASYTTVLQLSGSGTVNALNVTTTGIGVLKGTAANTGAHGYRNPTGNYDYSKTRLTGNLAEEYHVSANGTTYNGVTNTITAGSNMSVKPTVAGSVVSTMNVASETPQAGDIIEFRTINHGGSDYGEMRVNGRLVGGNTSQYLAWSGTATVSSDGKTFTVNSTTSGAIAIGQQILQSGNLFGDRVITGQIDATNWNISGGPLVSGLAVTAASLNTTWGGFSLTSAGVGLTGNHGWNGATGTTNGVDSHEGGDMTVVSRINIVRSGRVAQVEANGTIIYRGAFEYTNRAPTALSYRIHLASDNSVVASGSVSTFTTDGAGNGTYALPAFTPTTLATLYWHEIYRSDAVDALGNPATINGESGNIVGGYVILTNGQSLMTIANTSTGTVQAFAATGSNTWNPSAIPNQGQLIRTNATPAGGANSAKAALLTTFLAAVGASSAVSYVSGGLGGTAVSTRVPGSTDVGTYQVLKQVAQQQGLRPYAAIDISGQSDISAAVAIGTFSTQLQSIYTDLATLAGGAFPVFIMPVEAMWGYSDVLCETYRRFLAFELPTLDSRYKPAGFNMDLQHASADPLHPNADGFVEQHRRIGAAMAAYANPGSFTNRNGPTITGATRINATTVDVTIALGPYTALALSAGLGTNGKTDQWNGGLRFGTAVGTTAGITTSTGSAVSTITTEVYPTGCTITGTTGGVATVRYTFAANTFPGTAYISGPYGSNPFNRTNDATVNASMGTLASMLLGTLSGETSVPVQPYWNGTADYFSAS